MGCQLTRGMEQGHHESADYEVSGEAAYAVKRVGSAVWSAGEGEDAHSEALPSDESVSSES
jgi:hypothetical protein